MIALGCDHGGYELMQEVKAHLTKRGFEYKDFGCFGTEAVDYPEFGRAAAEAVASGECEYGIVICGTGIGMSIAANKHQGIRAGLCWTPEIGKLIKQHNNANVLVMPARFISYETVVEITDAWLTEEFEGGRHQTRIDKMPCCR